MSPFAIVEAGSKQFRIEPKSVIEVEKMEIAEDQKDVNLERVLFIHDGEKIHVGTPWIKGAKVVCDYLGNVRKEKVISFKYRRRKASRRKKGHRQELSRLLVKEISLS